MRYINVLILIFFFCAAMIFFIQNTGKLSDTITLQFAILKWQWVSIPIPTYLMILGSFVAGSFVATLFFLVEKIRMSRQLRQCRASLVKLENERSTQRPFGPETNDSQRLKESS